MGQKNHTLENHYECEICGKIFSSIETLTEHFTIHSGEKLFQCKICKKSFPYVDILRNHVKRSHENKNTFKCDVCKKIFISKGSLRSHVHLKHTGTKRFRCEFCGESFYRKDTFTVHVRLHTGERPYKCNICGKSYRTKDTLNKHMRCHPQEKLLIDSQDEENPLKNAEIKNKITEVERRFDSFRGEEDTEISHLAKTDGTKIQVLGNPFKCEICGKICISEQTLKQHLIIHSCEKLLECKTCKKSFDCTDTLTKHIKQCHKERTAFKCDLCEKIFSNEKNLQCHVQLHTVIDRYRCDICGISFFRKDYFEVHLRKHTGEKPYKCNTCGKSYSSMDSLNKHIITHSQEKLLTDSQDKESPLEIKNKITEEESTNDSFRGEQDKETTSSYETEPLENLFYQCKICWKLFSTKKYLTKHSAKHSSYNCKMCKQSFDNSDTLNEHIKQNHGDKPYKCYICGKSFRARDSLSKHIPFHQQEKILTDSEDIQNPLDIKNKVNVQKSTSGNAEESTLDSFGKENDEETICSAKADGSNIQTLENQFQCEICYKIFNSQNYLTKHLTIHSTYNCKTCKQSFDCSDNLKEHTRQNHNEKITYKCEICGKIFNFRNSLRSHIERHKGIKRFRCEYCGESFFRNENLKVHVRLHTGERPFKCNICGKTYRSKDSLNKHIPFHQKKKRLSHKQDLENRLKQLGIKNKDDLTTSNFPNLIADVQPSASDIDINEEEDFKKNDLSTDNFPCLIADVRTIIPDIDSNKEEILKKNDSTADNFQCQISDVRTVDPEIDMEIQDKSVFNSINAEKDFKKVAGDKNAFGSFISNLDGEIIFSTETNWLKSGTEQKPLKCKICGKKFATKKGLRLHYVVHIKGKSHQCQFCHKKFSNEQSLRQHFRIHTGEKPFQCEICDKSFCYKLDCTVHELNHKGIHPYTCKFCGKPFSRNYTLKLHLKTHSGEKRFKCGKPYSSNRTLRYHLKCQHQEIQLNDLRGIKTSIPPLEIQIKDDLAADSFQSLIPDAETILPDIDDSKEENLKKNELTTNNFPCLIADVQTIVPDIDNNIPEVQTIVPDIDINEEKNLKKNVLTTDSFPCLITNVRTVDPEIDVNIQDNSDLNSISIEKAQKMETPGLDDTHLSLLYEQTNEPMTDMKFPSNLVKIEENHEEIDQEEEIICGITIDMDEENGRSTERIESGKELFTCKICKTSYFSKQYLKNHERLHIGKRFKCEICEKSYYRNDRLQIHMTYHSGEKPFKCKTCGNSYRGSYTLSRHMKVCAQEKQLNKSGSVENPLVQLENMISKVSSTRNNFQISVERRMEPEIDMSISTNSVFNDITIDDDFKKLI